MNKPIFKKFIHIKQVDMTVLGTSVLKGPAIDRELSTKINDLSRTFGLRLSDQMIRVAVWYRLGLRTSKKATHLSIW